MEKFGLKIVYCALKGMEVNLHTSETLVLQCGEWLASSSSHIIPGYSLDWGGGFLLSAWTWLYRNSSASLPGFEPWPHSPHIQSLHAHVPWFIYLKLSNWNWFTLASVTTRTLQCRYRLRSHRQIHGVGMGVAGAQSRPVTLDKEIFSEWTFPRGSVGAWLDDCVGTLVTTGFFVHLAAPKMDCFDKLSLPTITIGLDWAPTPFPFLPMSLLDKTYIYMNTDTLFAFTWRWSQHVPWHVNNIAHIHMVHRPEAESTSKMINSESLQSVSKQNICVRCCGICTRDSCT